MNSQTAFYQAFGITASAFSRMEAEVRVILSGLCFSGREEIADAFLRNSQLRASLNTLRRVAKEGDFEIELKKIAGEIEGLVETRNLFIHGIWNPHTYGEVDGYAIVSDMNARHETLPNGARRLTWGGGERFSRSAFQKIVEEVREILNKCEFLRNEIERADSDVEFPSLTGSVTKYPPEIYEISSFGLP